MSTFSQKGGLYDRAKSRFGVSDGIRLFHWDFYQKRRRDAEAFFADFYVECTKARPTSTHEGLALLALQGRVQRHYTLNIDDLATQVGIDTWHPIHNPAGVTIEMHGNIKELVCPKCKVRLPLTPAHAKRLKSKRGICCPCDECKGTDMRPRIMLYDDKQCELIVAGSDDEKLWETMELDVASADTILWVGISFKQSASTEYFKKVRKMLVGCGKQEHTRHFVINPDSQTCFNIQTALSNFSGLHVVEVLERADAVIPLLARMSTPE